MKVLFAARGLPIARVRRRSDGRMDRGPRRRALARLTAAFALPGVREAGEPRVERRHQQGQGRGRSWRRRSISPAQFDRKIVVEAAVPNAREIEVAVLGNDTPEASVPGEIIPAADCEFYDYEAKYTKESGLLHPGAASRPEQTAEVRRLAVEAFTAVDGAGMGRVDFLLDGVAGTWYVSEINTIPGFTTISMYPKLWAASGRRLRRAARSPDRARPRAPRREAATCARARHDPGARADRGRAPPRRRGGRRARRVLPPCGRRSGASATGRCWLARSISVYDADFAGAERRTGAGLPAGAGPGVRGDRRGRALVAHLPRHRQPQPRRGVHRARERHDRRGRAVGGARAGAGRRRGSISGAAYGVRVQYQRPARRVLRGGPRRQAHQDVAREGDQASTRNCTTRNFGAGLYAYYADVAPAVLKMVRWLLMLPGGDRVEGPRADAAGARRRASC